MFKYNRNLIIDNILKKDINYDFEEIDDPYVMENTLKSNYELRTLSSDEAALFKLNFEKNKNINYEQLSKLSSGVLVIEVQNDN